MIAWWWLLVAFAGGMAGGVALLSWASKSFVPNNWR